MPIPIHYSEIVRNLRRNRFSFMTRTRESSNTFCDKWFGGTQGGLDSFVFIIGPSDNVLHTYVPYSERYGNGNFNRHLLTWYMENFPAPAYDASYIPLDAPYDLYPIQLNGEYVRDHPTIVNGVLYRDHIDRQQQNVVKVEMPIPKSEQTVDPQFLRKFNNLDMTPVR